MDTIALVWIGFGGSHADLEPSGNATGYVSGYETDAEKAVAGLSGRYSVPNGTPVIDKRPAIDKHGAAVSLRSPMLDLRAPRRFDPATICPVLAGGLAAAGGAYAALLGGAMTGHVNLDGASLGDCVAYWRAADARVGVVVDGKVVWS